MATRLDAVQIAVPRALTDAQQQHAAQRQPVVAQEHVATQVKQSNRAREQRPEAPQGAQGGRVRGELVPAIDPQDDPRDRRRGRRGVLGQVRAQSPAANLSTADYDDNAPGAPGGHVDLRI